MKQIPGQLSLFSVIWERYPGCAEGTCSCCGNKVAYSSGYGSNVWTDEKQRCIKCGAVFSEEDSRIPRELPVLSGISKKPIVLVIDCAALTQEDIIKHGGVEWLKHRRCTEWFSAETTAKIDAYIASQQRGTE